MTNITPLFPDGEDRDFSGSGGTELDLEGARATCLACGADLSGSVTYQRYQVCPRCRFHYTMSARRRVEAFADEGTFDETSAWIRSIDPLSFSTRVQYRDRLMQDQGRTGLTEAVITGKCAIGGNPAVLIVLDFGFLGGSMGLVVGEKVALALELAARKRWPAVAVINSGGARIQEGVFSLMQMAKTTVAVSEMRRRRAPLISVLSDPATGQVYASFGSQADLVFAEPGSHVGFAPFQAVQESDPRHRIAARQHTAEDHFANGMLDGVIDREDIRDVLSRAVELLRPESRLRVDKGVEAPRVPPRHLEAWEMVRLARRPDRPGAPEYIERIFGDLVELHGDRVYADAPEVTAGIGRLAGLSVMVIGQKRDAGPERPESGGSESRPGAVTPAGFAKARRAIAFASRFRLPVVALVDTPGPALDFPAWQRGQSYAISSTISALLNANVPTVSVLIGEGGSEAALAFAVTDRVLMLQNAIYTPISPERGARAEMRDAAGAEEVAKALRLTSIDCQRMGFVDDVVAEPEGGAHENPAGAALLLKRALTRELAEVADERAGALSRKRRKRYRDVGKIGGPVRDAARRELKAWRDALRAGARALRTPPKGHHGEDREARKQRSG